MGSIRSGVRQAARGDDPDTSAGARLRLGEMERAVEERTRQVAREADVYVHENPWKTAGFAAGLGAALGAMIGVLLARR